MNDPAPAFDAADHRWMARALTLARRGMYTTRPNPRVGCVLVRDGKLVGEGYHQRAGGPHAEVEALHRAGARARGATAYVTLEPCCHHGRTPPCSDALLAASVRRVVVAMADPNPAVDGGGLAALREAGVQVQVGLLGDAAAALNAGFVKRLRHGLPLLRVKLASSLDGRTALASGESRWITGPAARHDVQRWRARACAVLTGADTVLADDPSLTVRIDSHDRSCSEADSDVPQPLRVVVDGRCRVPGSARLLTLPGAVLVACAVPADAPAATALQAAGAELRSLPGDDGHVALAELLRGLAARGINEVHCECGPRLAGALLQTGLVDELLLYVAPHLLGSGARELVSLGPLTDMSGRLALQLDDVRRIGDDLRLLLRPR